MLKICDNNRIIMIYLEELLDYRRVLEQIAGKRGRLLLPDAVLAEQILEKYPNRKS